MGIDQPAGAETRIGFKKSSYVHEKSFHVDQEPNLARIRTKNHTHEKSLFQMQLAAKGYPLIRFAF